MRGRLFEEKCSFYDELKNECIMQVTQLCTSDFNGHFGRHIDGLNGAYGGHSVCERNLEARM